MQSISTVAASTLLLFLLFSAFHSCFPAPSVASPPAIKIGVLLAGDSAIGALANPAIQLALQEINSDQRILNGSHLQLLILDTNCSAFQGAAAAMELFKEEVVAVVGPQSSTVGHFIAQIAGAVQVPILSFAATDPSFSEYQYPYFLRVAHTDAVQMEALADLVKYYGWREIVAIHSDDDFGTNGIYALDNELAHIGARIVHRTPLVPGINRTAIESQLIQLTQIESRVIVVHLQQDMALMLFAVAHDLLMMSTGYAWIVTDSTASTLDASILDFSAAKSIQGIIGTRSYAPNSFELQSFLIKWKKLQKQQSDSVELNIYGLYAYDSMWMVAYAIDRFLRNGWTFNFEDTIPSPYYAGGNSELARLKRLREGPILRQQILQTKLNGTSGLVQLNMKGDRMNSTFEIVNMVGKAFHPIGYWGNKNGISSFPSGLNAELVSQPLPPPTQKLQNVIWPGDDVQIPRGWMLPNNGRPLTIAVPHKVGFRRIASTWNSSSTASSFRGFCIDVFENAVKYLPYNVAYNFVFFGNGNATPNYDEMIKALANQVFDAVVGDVTITTKRLQLVDFTLPYIQSGLVVLAPLSNAHPKNYAWAFLRPFTLSMWFTTGAFFLFTGAIIWMLEHKKNQHFRGRPKKQIATVLWFIFSTLFFAHREDTRSTLARCVLIIWLFVVLIITSSYTANLTSILTVQQLIPTIQGISSLQASNVPIGYQTGSFARDYLIGLNISAERLKPFSTIKGYAEALKLGPDRGGVGAIVDEYPYIQIFMQAQCGFAIAGQEFTKAGWGFAFPKNSQLALDMSTAILALTESGELQKIHDFWLDAPNCASISMQVEADELGLGSFWGLFLVTGSASILCLAVYIGRMLWSFSRIAGTIRSQEGGLSSRSAGFIKSFASFLNESSREGGKNREGSKSLEQGRIGSTSAEGDG